MAQPSNDFEWATDLNFASGSETGTQTKVTLGPAARRQGFIPSMRFVGQHVNYALNIVHQWLLYLKNLDTDAYFLGRTYPWTGTHTFSPTAPNVAGVTGTGAPSGNSRGGDFTAFGNEDGVRGTAGTTGHGVHGVGGTSGGVNAQGGYFIGGGGNADGCYGEGTGSGEGGQFQGGPTAGVGVYGVGGAAGDGVRGEGSTTGRGGVFVSGPSCTTETIRVQASGSTTNCHGVHATARGTGNAIYAVGSAAGAPAVYGLAGNSGVGIGAQFDCAGAGTALLAYNSSTGLAADVNSDSGCALRASSGVTVATDSNAAVYVIGDTGTSKIGLRAAVTDGKAVKADATTGNAVLASTTTGNAGVFSSNTGKAVVASCASGGTSLAVNSGGGGTMVEPMYAATIDAGTSGLKVVSGSSGYGIYSQAFSGSAVLGTASTGEGLRGVSTGSGGIAVKAVSGNDGVGVSIDRDAGRGLTVDAGDGTSAHFRLVGLSADPGGTAQDGDFYYNSSTKKLRFYNGTIWSDV